MSAEPYDILQQIKDAHLVGRGGAGFAAFRKWDAVRSAASAKKYVICNASEGEPDVHKDFFILEHYPRDVFEGMRLAMDYVGTKEAYMNINATYEERLHASLAAIVEEYGKQGYKMRIFREHPSYIGGEETALLNAIEGLRCQPRLKPPYPTEAGLFGKPTLVHNVETLFDVARISRGEYKDTRFYTVAGFVGHPGVFELPISLTVLQVLERTENVPKKPYFIQEGGGASGMVFRSDQIVDHPVSGSGSITAYDLKADPRAILRKWFDFYHRESCGKCTPCREGTYQLAKMMEGSGPIPWEEIASILEVLDTTSFCALGRSVPIPVRSYMQNVLRMTI